MTQPTPLAIDVQNAQRLFTQSSGTFAPSQTVRAVDGVSLQIPTGTCFGIVGESGCGKSTLARMILGLLPVTSGDIVVAGQRLSDMDRRARARLIQPVFQDPFSSLNPQQRIAEIVGLPLTAQGITGRERSDRVMDMLQRVGLPSSFATRQPAQLSGGQRQRVAIARALVLRPRIVVCDEPTSALDVSVQAQILNLLADLREELGLTYVFISHNLAVVEHVCDQVAVMYLGRIVEQAPTAELFETPTHPYTRALLASVLTPDPGRGIPDVGLGDAYPDPANIPAGCRFHPRCPSRDAACASVTPQPVRHGERIVECLLAPTLSAAPPPPA